ncbi:MAG: hypothetical protein V7L01_31860 [Nostoc sp.]|uniref:hypothetical protein n=1 Tax=Nostoc sp. TaxID=1180 RepID=UPI002FFCF182
MSGRIPTIIANQPTTLTAKQQGFEVVDAQLYTGQERQGSRGAGEQGSRGSYLQ